MNNLPNGNSPPASIEDMIRSAGDFVEVDRYLRPAVIEQTHAASVCRRAWRRGGILATVILFVTIPLGVAATNFSQRVAEKDLSRIEDLKTNLNRSDWSWGMVQIFQRVQSERVRTFHGEEK